MPSLAAVLLAAAPASDRLSQISRIITVALILAGVILLTGFTTKWLAEFQKGKLKGTNIELLEARGLGSRKYVQILRVGDKYLALAVCKDSVTLLCELKEEEIRPLKPESSGKGGFGAFLRAAAKKDAQDVEAGKKDL